MHLDGDPVSEVNALHPLRLDQLLEHGDQVEQALDVTHDRPGL